MKHARCYLNVFFSKCTFFCVPLCSPFDKGFIMLIIIQRSRSSRMRVTDFQVVTLQYITSLYYKLFKLALWTSRKTRDDNKSIKWSNDFCVILIFLSLLWDRAECGGWTGFYLLWVVNMLFASGVLFGPAMKAEGPGGCYGCGLSWWSAKLPSPVAVPFPPVGLWR